MIPWPNLPFPPPGWDLLVLTATLQGLCLAGLLIWRLVSRRFPAVRPPLWLLLPLGLGCLLGLGFGLLQRDATFCLGEACVLLLVLRMAVKRRAFAAREAGERP